MAGPKRSPNFPSPAKETGNKEPTQNFRASSHHTFSSPKQYHQESPKFPREARNLLPPIRSTRTEPRAANKTPVVLARHSSAPQLRSTVPRCEKQGMKEPSNSTKWHRPTPPDATEIPPADPKLTQHHRYRDPASDCLRANIQTHSSPHIYPSITYETGRSLPSAITKSLGRTQHARKGQSNRSAPHGSTLATRPVVPRRVEAAAEQGDEGELSALTSASCSAGERKAATARQDARTAEQARRVRAVPPPPPPRLLLAWEEAKSGRG